MENTAKPFASRHAHESCPMCESQLRTVDTKTGSVRLSIGIYGACPFCTGESIRWAPARYDRDGAVGLCRSCGRMFCVNVQNIDKEKPDPIGDLATLEHMLNRELSQANRVTIECLECPNYEDAEHQRELGAANQTPEWWPGPVSRKRGR